MFSMQIQHLCVCLCVCVRLPEKGDEVALARKQGGVKKQWLAAHIKCQWACRSSAGHHWAPWLAARFNSPSTSGKVCKGMQAGVRISPNLFGKLAREVGGGAFHLSFWWLQKIQRLMGQPRAKDVKLGGQDQTCPVKTVKGCQAGQRGEGSANRFGAGPTNSERCRKKEADQAGKLIWDKAHMIPVRLFEMKPCLVASLPPAITLWVLLQGMCSFCMSTCVSPNVWQNDM